MTAITDRILQAADDHAALLSQIADLEHAPLALEHQKTYLEDLKGTLTSLKKELESLKQITSKERKEHQDLRDSFARRYAHKLTGRADKFVSKIEREEREYLEATHNQKLAEEKEIYLEETIVETQQAIEELTAQNKEYEELQEKAKQLYKKVFEGPTPEFPEEDQMERAVKNAKESFAEAQTRYDTDKEAQKLVSKAEKLIAKGVGFCQSALKASTFDLWGGGQVADMIERDNLSKAQASLSQAQLLLAQATGMQPAIGPLPNVTIASGHFIGDVILNNPFSEVKLREKIKGTNLEMKQLHKKVKEELHEQKGRALDSKNNLGDAKAELAAARAELEKIRREVFEQVTGVKCASGTPPPYDASDSPPPVAFEARL